MMWGRYDDDDVTKLKLEVSRDYNSASGGASYLDICSEGSRDV